MNLFIAYSQEDCLYKKYLMKHLSPLIKNHKISIWDYERIIFGKNKNRIIQEAINKADIILLLISADFLACCPIDENQLLYICDSKQTHNTNIIPIILKPCLWQLSPFGGFKSLPSQKDSILSFEDKKDFAYYEIAKVIFDLL